MGQLKAGDHVVAAKALFGSCRYVIEELLPRFGVASTLVDGTDLDQWRAAVRPETKVFFLESPTNPTLEILDIAAIADDRPARPAPPSSSTTSSRRRCCRSPLELGATCVVYSATKHIDGQGRCLGGVILASEKFITDHIHTFLRQTGPSLSPFNAWVLLKGLETLPLRVEQADAPMPRDPGRCARRTSGGRAVLYPVPRRSSAGRARQAADEGRRHAGRRSRSKAARRRPSASRNALKIVKISNNLGDAKSLITHPATTTHQRFNEEQRVGMGISQGMLRLSVGLEDVEDLLEDLQQALATSLAGESARKASSCTQKTSDTWLIQAGIRFVVTRVRRGTAPRKASPRSLPPRRRAKRRHGRTIDDPCPRHQRGPPGGWPDADPHKRWPTAP